MVGSRVSHYRIESLLGEGGMGVVYLAEDEQLGRKVALKFISPTIAGDPAARARLIREARSASAVDHPNIATVYEAGEWEGQLFVAMAYYPGETLKARIARGPLSIDWLPGLYLEAVQREADAIHFLPRTTAPTLMLSGRYDYNFPDETSSKPFLDLLGSPAADKRRVLYDTGHNLPLNSAVRETLDWFDKYLGPVR